MKSFYNNFQLKYKYNKKRADRKATLQRVEKGVNLEKRAVLHAEETSRNRAEFRISRGLLCVGTASERKAESANAA